MRGISMSDSTTPGFSSASLSKRLEAVLRQHDAIALALQQALGDAAHGDRVVDDQHQRRATAAVAGAQAARSGRRGARRRSRPRRVAVQRGQRHRVVDQRRRPRPAA